MPEPLLQVRNLTICFAGSSAPALDNVSFDLPSGEAIGVLGESGAGKTTLANAVIGLLPPKARIVAGSIRWRGTELLTASEPALRKIRGATIALVPQEPELALNPVLRVGTQIDEVLKAHDARSSDERRSAVYSMLSAAGLPQSEIYNAYSHQLSGGQRQRVTIAQALVCKPSLLIADEPTSSLDNIVQSSILQLLEDLKSRLQLSLLFITHNPALLTGLADSVLVLYKGRVVEEGSFEQICRVPQHPFTQTVLKSIPPLPVT